MIKKEYVSDNLKTILILCPLILFSKSLGPIPWWSFVLPAGGLGVFIAMKEWRVSVFSMGFLTGFMIWLGTNLYFHCSFSGSIQIRTGFTVLLSMWLVSGLIGGVLTGLAVYTGKELFVFRTSKMNLLNLKI